jgi:aminopeptidase YwaD
LTISPGAWILARNASGHAWGSHADSGVNMWCKTITLFSVGLLLGQLAPLVQPAHAKPRPSEEALYMKYISMLVSEKFAGRETGTPEARKARDYLTEQLRQTGLKGAFRGKYQQPFKVAIGTEPDIQKLSVIQAKKTTAELQPGRDINALALSASGSFSGQAVFVGYAISSTAHKYDNFAKLPTGSLKGKIAIAMRYEPHDKTGQSNWTDRPKGWTYAASLSSKISLAAQHGVSGLLIVNPQAYTNAPPPHSNGSIQKLKVIPVMHVSIDAFKRLLNGASLNADKEMARLQTLAHTDAKPAAEIPGLKLSGKITHKARWANTCNIAVMLPGRGKLAGETIIVGAHWDHVGRMGATQGPYCPGADDNASGSAGLLILAKRLADRAAKDTSKHRRTIALAWFGAEELGLIGSKHLAANLKDLGPKMFRIAAMINMDMIGRLKDNKASVWGVDRENEWEKLVRSSAKNSKIKLRLYGMGFGLSDHASFQRLKIPLANFTTGIHPDVHRISDTADKINSAGAISMLNIVDRLIETLAILPGPIPYDGPNLKSVVRPGL